MSQYVDLDTMEVVTHQFLQRKYSTYKRVDFTEEELANISAAVLHEPLIAGDVKTGKAVLNNGKYEREYRNFTQEELDAQAKQADEARKLMGVEFEGVMCSATADDMFGLAAIKPYVEQGVDINYHFDNGSVLTLTQTNIAAFEAVWFPFRQSFFV